MVDKTEIEHVLFYEENGKLCQTRPGQQRAENLLENSEKC
jgi:hypothetical protein